MKAASTLVMSAILFYDNSMDHLQQLLDGISYILKFGHTNFNREMNLTR